MAQAAQQRGSVLEILLDESLERRSLASRRVQEALDLANRAYAGRMHWTGWPLADHVAGMLRIFLGFRPEEDAVIGCLLHHVLEVKAIGVTELETRFGEAVRSLVSAVHLLSHVSTRNRRTSIDNLRLMFLRVSDDPRAVLMILADQCEQLDHVERLGTEERRRLCQDALDIFAPVAARLGVYSLKNHLESRAFPIIYPTDAVRIMEQLEQLHAQHGDFLEGTAMRLSDFLASSGVHARVEGREKQLYSIFVKMMQKSITHVRDLYDLFALRVIVDTEASCYQALGLLHQLGHPLPNRFKDFIAFPKPNGYQSLHTTLARLPGVPEGVFVEVQIRTEAMHREAEYGIAAHWNYKEKGDKAAPTHPARVTEMLALQHLSAAGAPLARASDHIFVLTPKGDIVELPEGATPLDFAFSVHTELGLAFKAARVNGAIAPLNHHLDNGDVVEILRHGDPRPSPQWLQLLRAAPARQRLRRYLAARDAEQRLAEEKVEAPRARPKKKASPVRAQKTGVEIDTDIRMPVRYARCCKPDEGKRGPLCGVVSRTGEVRVHRAECRMMKGMNPERRMKVKWKVES